MLQIFLGHCATPQEANSYVVRQCELFTKEAQQPITAPEVNNLQLSVARQFKQKWRCMPSEDSFHAMQSLVKATAKAKPRAQFNFISPANERGLNGRQQEAIVEHNEAVYTAMNWLEDNAVKAVKKWTAEEKGYYMESLISTALSDGVKITQSNIASYWGYHVNSVTTYKNAYLDMDTVDQVETTVKVVERILELQ
ncbi:hypothetical protein ACWOEH_05255 [Enterococcus nangangensis]